MGAAVRSRAGLGRSRSMSPVRLEEDGRVGTLTLHRPDLRNALDLDGVEELRAAIADLGRRTHLRAAVLASSRGGVFCAGLEYPEIFRIDGEDNPFTKACDELSAVRIPTVCAVGDGAYGAGADLALACDFRVGSRDCRVRVPAAALGIHYDGAGLRRAITAMGPQGARRLFLAAETLDAEALLRLGFLDEIAETAEVVARARARAGRLCELAPRAAADLKQSIGELAAGAADAGVLHRRVAASWRSADFREGAQARAEKRRPRFQGC